MRKNGSKINLDNRYDTGNRDKMNKNLKGIGWAIVGILASLALQNIIFVGQKATTNDMMTLIEEIKKLNIGNKRKVKEIT